MVFWVNTFADTGLVFTREPAVGNAGVAFKYCYISGETYCFPWFSPESACLAQLQISFWETLKDKPETFCCFAVLSFRLQILNCKTSIVYRLLQVLSAFLAVHNARFVPPVRIKAVWFVLSSTD